VLPLVHVLLQPLYTQAEIAAIKAMQNTAPTVSYSATNGLVDQPVDWSGLTPMIRNVGGCGAW
jgi:hypothetical protein